jgi:cytochrome c-type biogenesis protein CcmH
MMRRVFRAALLAFCLAGAPAAQAVQPDEILADAAMEARARAISAELRCMVCQNQSIDDSDAGLARDLRLLVRARLKAGDSDAAVFDYLHARYGDFILLKPPFNAGTALLWALPALALLAGGAAIARGARRRRVMAGTEPLNAAEQAALDAALDRDSGTPRA